ncbi:TonB family protein [Simiduia curdlanivorans]|uniref:Protein TonB n=1 Tax=Simiduia curdlanivorans TaxID=1492769 RepID=A0ABV8V0R0_9GAMM|nr:TonB family protein [Simiduia curdlanivorans]MDN3637675.1 TonB family protein [Simiduia curdlanivorans]
MLTINLLISLTLKPLLLMGLAYALFRQDKQRSASHQHLLATVILWSLPLLIGMSFLLPALPLQTEFFDSSSANLLTQPWQEIVLLPWVQALVAVYLFALLFQIFYLLLGLALLRKIEQSAKDFEQKALLEKLKKLSGCAKPVTVKVSQEIHYPQVWGWKNPTLLLPQAATGASKAQLQLMLLHELGHVARNDWPIRQATRLVCALFWFLPPVWWLAKQQVELSERATDDWVLERNHRTADYAELLLQSAQALKQDLPTEALNGSPLFQRISLLLDPHLDREAREPQSLALALLITGLLALAISSGQVMPKIALQPSSALVLTWQAMETANNKVVTDNPLANQLNAAVINKHDFASVARAPAKPQAENMVVLAERYSAEGETLRLSSTVEIGSPGINSVMPIALITPTYPRTAIKRGIEGLVRLEFSINSDGRAENILALSSPNTLLTNAAINALTASQFARPRLQGQAFTLTKVTEEYRFQLTHEPPDT